MSLFLLGEFPPTYAFGAVATSPTTLLLSTESHRAAFLVHGALGINMSAVSMQPLHGDQSHPTALITPLLHSVPSPWQ